MSVYINSKKYLTNIVIDRGLNNVDIISTDIRPGKISIDNNGNKLSSESNEGFLKKLTPGTARSSDITKNKILYVNGIPVVGTAKDISDKSNLINGMKYSYIVAPDNMIVSGDFISLVSNTVYKFNGTYDISGVAVQSGNAGETIEVVVPN